MNDCVRTCLACRKRAEKGSLLRFVRALDGEICFDEKADLPYRGAWLCPHRPCLVKAFKKRILFRGEKNLPMEVDHMIDHIRKRIADSALSRLGLMRRQRKIEIGKDPVLRAIDSKKAYTVIFSRDFSARSMLAIESRIGDGKSFALIRSPFSMEEFARYLGSKKTGVVAIEKCRITDEVVFRIDKLIKIDA